MTAPSGLLFLLLDKEARDQAMVLVWLLFERDETTPEVVTMKAFRYLLCLLCVGCQNAPPVSSISPPSGLQPAATASAPGQTLPTTKPASLAVATSLAASLPTKLPIAYLERVKGDATKPLPMVVALQGMGDTPENFAALFNGYEGELRVIVPKAELPHNNGFTWAESGDRVTLGQAAKKVEALIALLPSLYPTEGKPIVVGFSQGGMLAFVIAAQRPDLIQAAIPLSGYLPSELMPKTRPASTIMVHAIHGDADGTISLSSDEKSLAALRAFGFETSLTKIPGVGHALPQSVRQALYEELTTLLSHPAP